MRNYALSLKLLQIRRDRQEYLEDELNEEESNQLMRVTGDMGWPTRQLRCDLVFESGCLQRCKAEAWDTDLVKAKQYTGLVRRGADLRLRYWSDVSLKDGVILHLANSAYANGTPEKNELMRYRSIGGYFILIANPAVLEGREVRANVICFHSGQTKRVYRSTLAIEAIHLAEAIETGDWVSVLLEESTTRRHQLEGVALYC